MFDTRIIRRLAYDGNYQRAIELIVDIIDGKKNYFEVKEDLEKRRKAGSIIRENARLKSCLQEIKKIAERQLLVTNVRTYQMVYYADFSQYRNNILDLITKAEEQ